MKLWKKYRKIKKLPNWFYFVPAQLVRFIVLCMRPRFVDPSGAVDLDKLPYITVTWHNRLLFFPSVFPQEYRSRTYALVSPSRDGQYVTDFISQFGIKTVRGSSNKRSVGALLESLRVLEQGGSVSMTPDGPRGPRYKMSLGPIALASKTGFPILPISVNATRFWEVPTWDRFQIPKPWGRLELRIGSPIKVPKDLDDSGLEEWRMTAEKALMAISEFGAG